MKPRNSAAIAVTVLAFVMWLYVREFAWLSKTLEVKSLVIGSMLVVGIMVGAALWKWKDRFTPWSVHFPEVILMLVFSMVFAPLLGSLLNRGLGTDESQSFDFVSETAYYSSGYGILKAEKLKPSGWKLTLREKGQELHLKYKSQSYFPITKPGEKVLLPIRHGIFGVRVVQFK